ncbi:AraC family transcriptional regulator [Tamlana sp. 2201CG12-4]|uniref:helix-turn-helix domain-containing protein n=1 Tax=Tamlana sp. 2201CG12-4 TaxID=3112582 RepID=UPI002DBFFBA2|nr:AraC family transcriptional regulator [Tamlana sp. 2201CG12-4]MEC3908509.1 AraC family transcriptional regulator [Tamlana sp. 2201CG12-4]
MHQFQSLKLKLLNAGYAKLDHKWDFNNVISPFSRLYLITKGQAFVYHNNIKYDLIPGYLYLIPSYTYSSYKCNLYHEQYYISFFEELGNSLSIYNFANFKYQIKANALDKILFERLLDLNQNRALVNNAPKHYDNYKTLLEFEKKNKELSSSAFIETQGVLKALLSRFFDGSDIFHNKTPITNLNQVLQHISENLNQNITVKSLAEFCHLSTDHFSRRFKKIFGLRPSKYIQNKRIERAILLISTTNYSLTRISTIIGFENYNHFSRIFKQTAGITPSNFKKQQHKDIIV